MRKLLLARPIREGAVFLVRLVRPHTSSDEAHRIAFGFSPPDDRYFATRLRDGLGERGRTPRRSRTERQQRAGRERAGRRAGRGRAAGGGGDAPGGAGGGGGGGGGGRGGGGGGSRIRLA